MEFKSHKKTLQEEFTPENELQLFLTELERMVLHIMCMEDH